MFSYKDDKFTTPNNFNTLLANPMHPRSSSPMNMELEFETSSPQAPGGSGHGDQVLLPKTPRNSGSILSSSPRPQGSILSNPLTPFTRVGLAQDQNQTPKEISIFRKKEPVKDQLSVILTDAVRKLQEEGACGELSRGVGSISYERGSMDFNDYKPVQRIPLSNHPINIATVNHSLANHIIGIQFDYRVAIFELERKKEETDEFFTLMKLQEMHTVGIVQSPDPTSGLVSALAIDASSITRSPGKKRLSYAFGLAEESSVYLVCESTFGEFKHVMTPDAPEFFKLTGHSQGVTHLAFDAEQGEFLASLSDDITCIIWGVRTKTMLCQFPLDSMGISCLWHPSEPYKLLIIEQEGKIRMYNALKQCIVVTLNTLIQPVYCADWSITNSLIVGIGSHKSVYMFDLSVLNSEPGRRIDTHFGATNFIKFSTMDNQMFTTAACYPRGEIKTFQKSFLNHVWCQKRECIQSIAWIYGEPFLLALSGQQLIIYESSLL